VKVFYWISIGVLIISLLNFVLETTYLFRIPFKVSANKTLTRQERFSKTVPHPILRLIEFACNIFFTMKILVRFTTASIKLKFFHNFYNILDCLSIIPLFLPNELVLSEDSLWVILHNYAEIMYILRIFKIFTIVPKYR
jgi:hypothetical protein